MMKMGIDGIDGEMDGRGRGAGRGGSTPAALYVHIPFCVRKCLYCNFYSVEDLSLKSGFLKALMGEMALYSHAVSLDTVYFGGGTPSLLSHGELSRLFAALHRCFTLSSDAEITMEVNPGTLAEDDFRAFRSLGINRLNIGVQSFRDDKLKFLGRIHDGATARQVIRSARSAGFDNLGLDLICGVPHESRDLWLEDLKAALDFLPEHLSCYLLTYEPGTPMIRKRDAGKIKPLGDGPSADLFRFTSRYLEEQGYLHYEISNFARTSGLKSRHNQAYWRGDTYLGLGPSAHAFDGIRRSWNVSSVKDYVTALDAGRLPVEGSEILTLDQSLLEMVMLGLRTREGMDIRAFEKKSGEDFEERFRELLNRVEQEGWLRRREERLALSLDGMVYLDGITGLFAEGLLRE